MIIPNKDHTVDLDNCIRPMLTEGTYKNLEFVIVENNSTEQATWTYYEKIQKEFPNVHVVRWEREFNYSAINNFGVKNARGEYLLFLNNDVRSLQRTGWEKCWVCVSEEKWSSRCETDLSGQYHPARRLCDRNWWNCRSYVCGYACGSYRISPQGVYFTGYERCNCSLYDDEAQCF